MDKRPRHSPGNDLASTPGTVRRRSVDLWLIAGGLAVLGVTSWMALPESVSALEEAIFRFFNDWPDWLEAPGWPFMQFGALAVVPIVAAGAWFVWRSWRPAAAVVLGAGTAWLLAKVIKDLVERGRPAEYLADVNIRPEWSGLGFVSGHAAIAVAMAIVLSAYATRRWKVVLWCAAGATLALRMYTGAHLPLDIIGGAALGAFTVGLTHLLLGVPVLSPIRAPRRQVVPEASAG